MKKIIFSLLTLSLFAQNSFASSQGSWTDPYSSYVDVSCSVPNPASAKEKIELSLVMFVYDGLDHYKNTDIYVKINDKVHSMDESIEKRTVVRGKIYPALTKESPTLPLLQGKITAMSDDLYFSFFPAKHSWTQINDETALFRGRFVIPAEGVNVLMSCQVEGFFTPVDETK